MATRKTMGAVPSATMVASQPVICNPCSTSKGIESGFSLGAVHAFAYCGNVWLTTKISEVTERSRLVIENCLLLLYFV